MNYKELFKNEIFKRLLCIVLLIVIAILSCTVISKIATSPETYKTTIQSIDNKKATVMGVTTTTAITSTAMASVIGDATTPIANQIMEFGSYLFVVVCVLVLEKSLLTVMGYLSFNILIPIACVLMGIYTFIKKKTLKLIALKIIIFALVIVVIIPFSMRISDIIYDANKTTVEQVTMDLEENISDSTEDEESLLNKFFGKIKKGASDIGEKAKLVLNKFIDAIALFVISYCVLPVIIVFLVIWLINFLFKVNIQSPNIDLIKIKKYLGTKEKNNDDLKS